MSVTKTYTPGKVDGSAQSTPVYDAVTDNGDGTVSPKVTATSAPAAGAVTDRSGTIAAGGTAQQVMAANTTRKYLFYQNNSDTDQWINWGVVAVANEPSIKIVAGASYENPAHFCPSGLISVFCATTGKTFTSKEF